MKGMHLQKTATFDCYAVHYTLKSNVDSGPNPRWNFSIGNRIELWQQLGSSVSFFVVHGDLLALAVVKFGNVKATMLEDFVLPSTLVGLCMCRVLVG
jgi:hypothetical protein